MDILLKEFFKKERWESAIDIGVGKKIDKSELRSLCSPETRVRLYNAIKNDNYAIAPPRIALIPKDEPGKFREVMICENIDRIVLSIINNMFFELFPEFVHNSCYSYRSGIGCGRVVQAVSRECEKLKGDIVGKKYDLQKYFDNVAIKYIDELFDKMELKYGKSKIIDIVREFYHSDILFDENGELITTYKSIKQGTATSSFMADALLYHIDETLSNFKGVRFWRYSDDILILGNNYKAADRILKDMLMDMGLTINPKKEQVLDNKHFFKFLGFQVKGSQITLSKSRVKSFQKEIEKRTIKPKNITPKRALNQVNSYLYKGDGTYSWATSVLPIINVEKDIDTLNTFVMDALRACATKKKKIGGLGSVNDKEDYTILRGVGKNVTANRNKTPKEIEGYLSIRCMQNALVTRRAVYETLVRSL
jgi:retron-type reverse transcriptase